MSDESQVDELHILVTMNPRVLFWRSTPDGRPPTQYERVVSTGLYGQAVIPTETFRRPGRGNALSMEVDGILSEMAQTLVGRVNVNEPSVPDAIKAQLSMGLLEAIVLSQRLWTL